MMMTVTKITTKVKIHRGGNPPAAALAGNPLGEKAEKQSSTNL